jgi:hypothetical protein
MTDEQNPPPIVITYEQLVSDSNHYVWRAAHGEVFDIEKDGRIVAELGPPLAEDVPELDQAAVAA